MFGNLHRGAKLAALIATGVVTLGGVAAATGTLPGPAQGVAHDALGAAGVGVPDDGPATTSTTGPALAPTDEPTTTVDPATTTSEPADASPSTGERGPDPNGPAKHGLCTASAAGKGGAQGGKGSSTAFRALADAAAAGGETVEEFCAGAEPGGRTSPDSTTPTTEPTTVPIPPGATQPRPAGAAGHGDPPVTTPNHGAAASGHGNPHRG